MKNKIVIRSLIISLALLFVMGLLLAVIPVGKRAKSYADVAYNTVGFEKTSAGINDMGDVYYFGNWFKVKVIVKGNAGEVVSFRYYTESGTAIPGVDYVEQSKTVSVKIAANGQETYIFSVQCILKYNTRERVHVLADGEEYGRYFKIKIDSVENAVVEEGKDVCKCTLPYDSKVKATVGSVTEVYGGRREIAYFDDYADTLSVASSGEYDVEDKTSWKSWENGVVFDRQTLIRWYNTLIGSGLASAWGSFFFGKICDGSSDIYLSAGGADMMKAYSSPSSDTLGMSLQLVFDPDTETILLVHKHDIAYQLNGRGHYLISMDKNPNDDNKYYIDVKDKYVKSAYKRAYWIQDGTTWYANDGAVVDSVFYEIEKISDIDFGIAVYSNSDIFVKNVSLFMKLMDNKAPVIMGSYVDDSQFMNTGKLRLAIRFSEPVYTSKILSSGERNTLELKINNKSTPCYAQYVEGNYTDTLIYEIDAEDLPKTNITSIQYKFSDNDIGDMAYAMNQYKVIENNFLVNADLYREFSMNGSINFFQPDLTVDKGSSMQDKNLYNIMLSINADENAEGNVYYEWSTDNVKQDNLLESAYEFSYKLREEDSGSLGVTLVKNESAGIFSGTYYLHALAVSPYGLKDYKCFGPYKLDGDPPTISTNIPTNELKTKIFELNNSKEGGAEIINVDFVVEWKDGNGKTQTAKRTLLDNGERTTGLFRALTDNQKYQYSSNIDDSLTEQPLDEFILEIMGDEMRLDANVSFEVKDSAGNMSETPAVRVVYDKRNVFKVDSDFPAEYGYVKIEDISTTYNAYDIAAADRSDGKGISISVQTDDRSQIVLGETAFSVRVNGVKTYTASDSDPYTVVIGDLGSGFYELIPSITGETGGAEVDLVSNPICFYLTNGKNDDTANKLRTQEDMVFTNKVFQINDARYYYLDVAGSVVSSHLYGATYDSVMNRYNGGSLAPTFSTSTEAKKYVKYMEYQDLHLVQITANMASLLNSSSGSTTYMKAPGETATAQEGQLWIRYKRSSWTNNSNAYGWAYYYYGIGSVSAGINITYLSGNLTNAINTVVNRIVAAGESINLVQESQLDQTTGAPYLSTTQIHVKSEIALSTKTGITFVVNPTYEGDAKIYKNTVVVEGIELPLATNLIVTKNDNTELYYKFGESSTWTKINAQNGRPLCEALVNNASGIYTIREYGDSGVCEFKIYYDRTLPLLELTINNEPLTLDGTELNLSGATTTFTSLKNEVDDLAYIAIYTYPTRELLTVLYKADVPNYSLDSGNYYVQVGDRAGNVVTYTLLLSSSTLEVTATENESKTAVVVRVNSRDDSEIYTYEVYLNEELITNEFAAVRSFKEPGLYRIIVTDIYGNFYTKTVEHNYQSPKITWYYLNDMDSYSKYDESRTSKMIVSNDVNNVRVTNVYTSTLIRLQFDLASANSEIKFEMQDIDSGFYTYSSSTGVLSVNALYNWTLRVWYEDHPENDHVYICQIDTNAPSFDASFIGKVFSLSYDPERLTQEELASIGEGNSILPTSIGYTAENKSATYSLYNGSVIEGNHISIKMFDRSDIKSYSVTRNGQTIDMSLDASGALLINSYGVYEITATDKLGNTSTFSFVNTKEAVSSATMGENNLKKDTTAMGHEPLVVTTKYSGNTTILIQTTDGKNDCYVFNFDGNTVTYGSYFVGSESDLDETDIKLYFAEFITASGFSLSLSGDGVRQNRWYSVVDNDYYTVSVMFDAQSCAVYKVDCKQKEFTVSVLASVGNGKIPDYYIVKMSQEKTDISIYADEIELEIDKNSDYTYVAGTLTLAQSGISDKYPTVVKIEVAFSETPSFNNYAVVYQAVYKSESEGYTVSFDGFTGEDDGYYQFVIYNVFGNVTTYTICKVESFTTIVTARYQDEGNNEYIDVLDRIIRSNKEISLLVFSDNVHFIVNGETYEGVKVGATTELVLNMPGRYEVRVVAANGIYKEFEFEIGTDYEFSFVEEWLTGYNEKALLKEQGYTNNRLTVQLTDSVKYVEVVYNDQTKTVVYDELSGETINDPELLQKAIGKSGNGVYVVNFRDKYGDVLSKTIHFSTLPQISISRRTLNSQNVWNSYSYGQAVIGIYSNYQIRFETSSNLYEFKINDNIVSLEEPRIIEFGNTGGNGRFEYKISFTDEYGNMLLTRAILMRADVQIDKPQMKEVFVDGVRYTKDNVAITFAKGLTASVSVGGTEPVKYTSGTTFYKDGNYTFIIEDVAGNRLEYTIVHKSVNNFTLTDRTTELPIILGSVINNSAVIFRTTDNSSIKTLVKNGKLVSDYDSNVFSSTGHYEMLIEDLIGNQAYAEFYIVNNSIGEFEYFAPYGYEIKEVWKADGSENSKLIETDDDYILLDQNGDYVVLVAGKEILSSFRFTVTVDNTPPTAVLDGVENGGTTARNVSIKGLKAGDQVSIYKDGRLIEVIDVTLSTDVPQIETGGDYRVVVTNVQGVSTEYTFTRKKIANAATSIFLIVLVGMVMSGIAIGLLYHTKHKTDA